MPDWPRIAEGLLNDASPLVRGMAVWALTQLDPDRLTVSWRDAETDPEVLAEWETVDVQRG